MLKARDIMLDASVILLDDEHVRWPLDELARWIDDGVSAIITAKPNTAPAIEEMTLARGTRQRLSDDPAIVRLLDVPRNMDVSRPGAGGRMIRPTTRANLDTMEPRWHDPAYMPFRREVRQVVFDELDPRSFFTFPGNDGLGKVEILIAKLPKTVISQKTGDGSTLSHWDCPIGIPDNYRTALLDYVLYRCFSKEEPAASAGRAVTHYQAFASTVGIQVQVEKANGPNRRQ
jgi:hypothetical protein